MESHIKILGVIYVVLGAMGVLGAVTLLVIFGGLAGMAGVADRSPDAAVAIPVLGSIGGILFFVILLFSLPGLIVGIGLVRLAPWSRVFGIVVSALHLLGFPFGTALGIYGIWVLTKPESAALLSNRRYQQTVY